MKPVRAMLFDLDGTLLDSAPDLVAALNQVRISEGLEPVAVEDYGRYASKGAAGLLNAGLPAAGQEQFEAWRQIFLSYYANNSVRGSYLYPGVPELLSALDLAGIPWGIVTNKIESLTHPIIDALGLQDRVGCVICGDTAEQSKPHPAPVLLACDRLRAEPAETLFVGDDVRDIEAGRAAGTLTAAVYYGYGSHEFRGELVEDSIPVHHPADLIPLVK